MKFKKRLMITGSVALFALVLSACAGGDGTSDDAGETEEPAAEDGSDDATSEDGSDDATSEDESDDASSEDGSDDAASEDGTDDGSAEGDDGLAMAQANIDAFRAIQDFDPIGDPFDASAAAGKTVFTIPSGAIDFHFEILAGIEEAASAADVTITDCPNQGTVQEWVECFNQGLNLGPDLIMLQGSPSPSQLQPQIEAANEAGIPVIANHHPRTEEFPEGSLPETHDTGLTAFQPGPFGDAAELIADFALVNQPDQMVNMLILTADETPASVGMREMIQARLAETCPDTCTTTVVNVPIPDWGTRLQSETTTALNRDPDINWVVPIYDGMYFAVAPGIEASGRADEVRTVSFNGGNLALQSIADGVVDGTMGENLNWIGWSSMDQALRILAGVDPIDFTPIDRSPTPLRVFDASNIEDTGTPPEQSRGYGDAYKPGYLELWGLEG